MKPEASFLEPDMFRPSIKNWPFGDLVAGAYQMIMADPPWAFELYSEEGEEKSGEAGSLLFRTRHVQAINQKLAVRRSRGRRLSDDHGRSTMGV